MKKLSYLIIILLAILLASPLISTTFASDEPGTDHCPDHASAPLKHEFDEDGATGSFEGVTFTIDGEKITFEPEGSTVEFCVKAGDQISGVQTGDAYTVNWGNGISYVVIYGVTPPPQPAISLVKSASPSIYSAVGDVIAYNFTVENTGNVNLTNVKIDDPVLGITGLAVSPSTLAPGQTGTATADYAITQADIDAGSFTNTATATGTPPSGPDVTDDDTETVTYQEPDAPSISLVKSASPSIYSTVGDVITYNFTVENTGNVNLTNVKIDDLVLGITGLAVSPSTLAPRQTGTATANYAITQADIDAGQVLNTATATGTPPSGPDVTDDDTETVTYQEPDAPSISLVKSASPSIYSAVGEVITYTFTVENTGNVTLTNVTLTDPDAAVSGGPIASLAPGASDSTTFTATYTITQADIDAVSFTNTATVTGTPTSGPADNVTAVDTATVTYQEPDAPSINLVKTADPLIYHQVGDVITYAFTVTNTGNVTLTNVTLTDNDAAVSGGSIASLAAGASDSTTFTATYTITLADIHNGSFTNTATVTGYPPTGEPVTAVDTARVEARILY
jgi:uncharacterized repeat protein (TIGR01451 family)